MDNPEQIWLHYTVRIDRTTPTRKEFAVINHLIIGLLQEDHFWRDTEEAINYGWLYDTIYPIENATLRRVSTGKDSLYKDSQFLHFMKDSK